MLKVSDTNDSAESSKKPMFNCLYSHKSLLNSFATSRQFLSQGNFDPQKLHLEVSPLLLSGIVFLLEFSFFKFWLFPLKDPL